MNKAPDAMVLAMTAHAKQVRKYTGEPYWHHLAEVAGMVAAAGGPDAAICASFLHDIREDQGFTASAIREQFGPEVEAWVTALSDLEPGNRAARKAAARQRLAAAPYWVQTIKYADIISNASSIKLHDPKFAPVFCSEVQALLDVMDKGYQPLYFLARVATNY